MKKQSVRACARMGAMVRKKKKDRERERERERWKKDWVLFNEKKSSAAWPGWLLPGSSSPEARFAEARKSCHLWNRISFSPQSVFLASVFGQSSASPGNSTDTCWSRGKKDWGDVIHSTTTTLEAVAALLSPHMVLTWFLKGFLLKVNS